MKKLVYNVGIYTLGSFISQFVSFLLIPVLTRYLSPEDYGKLATFNSLLLVFTVFILFSQDSSFARHYWEYEGKKRAAFLGNTFFVSAAVACSTLFLIVVFRMFFRIDLGFDSRWLYLIFVAAILKAVSSVFLGWLQLEKRAILYNGMMLLSMVTDISIALALIIVWRFDWVGRVSGIMISLLVSSVVGLSYLVRKGFIRFHLNRDYLRQTISFSLPLVPASLSGWGLTLMDRLLLNQMTSLKTLGLYNVGYSFGQVVFMLTVPFSRAWMPFFYELIGSGREEDKKRIAKVIIIAFFTLCFVALVLGVNAEWVVRLIVAKEYWACYKYVPLVAFAYTLQGTYAMLCLFLIYLKKTYLMASIDIAGALMNLTLNIILVRYYGATGAALALLLSYTVLLLLTLSCVVKSIDMPWKRSFVELVSYLFSRRIADKKWT